MKSVAAALCLVLGLNLVAGLTGTNFAAAETRSDIAERVLDYLYPHRVKRVPLPLPPSRPVEIVPAPEVLPVPPPVLVWPDPPPLEQKVETPPPIVPALPRVEPKSEPPKQADRSKTFRKEGQQRTKKQEQPQQREPIAGGGQQAPVKCTPLPPKDCNQICKYARTMSESAAESLAVFMGYCRPTPQQRAGGKACVRSHCPEVLKK